MHVLFEEHAAAQRAGGIDAATDGLIHALAMEEVLVTRRFADATDKPCARPDCVHIHGIWSPVLAKRVLHWRHQGIPCVVTTHGMLAPWALAHKRLKKRIAWHIYQKRLLNLASALHATSGREADELLRLGLSPRIEVIPWGIGMPEEEEGSRIVDRGLWMEEEEQMLGVSAFPSPIPDPRSPIPDPVSTRLRTALFVGRIYPVKGLPMLVEAWAKVRPAGWKMKIVGPDEAGHLAEVQAAVRQAGLELEFEFTGALTGESLRKAYADADLFILPSFTENFGMVVAESLSQGVPVIATQGSPWEGLLEHGCGWWTDISSAGIADALRTATSAEPAVLRRMGATGRAWVRRDFSWTRCATRMTELYRSAMSC